MNMLWITLQYHFTIHRMNICEFTYVKYFTKENYGYQSECTNGETFTSVLLKHVGVHVFSMSIVQAHALARRFLKSNSSSGSSSKNTDGEGQNYRNLNNKGHDPHLLLFTLFRNICLCFVVLWCHIVCRTFHLWHQKAHWYTALLIHTIPFEVKWRKGEYWILILQWNISNNNKYHNMHFSSPWCILYIK